MTPKQKDIAQKLLALAKQGVNGEAANAEDLLNKYLKKHGLTLEDIDSEQVKEYYIDLGRDDEKSKFFSQVVSSVGGDEIPIFILTNNGKKWLNATRFDSPIIRQKVRLTSIVKEYHCTEAERAEILSSFYFYWDEYQRHKNLFYRAFIQKQRLFSNASRSKPSAKEDLTEEDLEMLKIAEGIERKTKQLRLE